MTTQRRATSTTTLAASLVYVDEATGGRVETHWHDDVTIETVYTGVATPVLLERAERDMRKLLAEKRCLYRLVNTLGITKYNVAIKAGVEELWTRFKALGGREIVFVTTMPTMKMSGAVAGMNTDVQVSFFSSREEAIAYLERKERPSV